MFIKNLASPLLDSGCLVPMLYGQRSIAKYIGGHGTETEGISTGRLSRGGGKASMEWNLQNLQYHCFNGIFHGDQRFHVKQHDHKVSEMAVSEIGLRQNVIIAILLIVVLRESKWGCILRMHCYPL